MLMTNVIKLKNFDIVICFQLSNPTMEPSEAI